LEPAIKWVEGADMLPYNPKHRNAAVLCESRTVMTVVSKRHGLRLKGKHATATSGPTSANMKKVMQADSPRSGVHPAAVSGVVLRLAIGAPPST